MVKTSIKKALAVGGFALATILNAYAEPEQEDRPAENKVEYSNSGEVRSFGYMGKTYSLINDNTAVRNDDNRLIFKRDEDGWFYDEDNSGKRDNNDGYMADGFAAEANSVRSVEDAVKDTTENKKGSFGYMGRTYSVDGDTATRDDITSLVFKRDKNGWFYDENNNTKRDSGEDMADGFATEADNARSVEDTVKDTVENGVEDKEGAFNYMGKGYTLTDNDTAVRDDDNTLTFKRNEEGGWSYDENNNGKIDSEDEDMNDGFATEANKARSVEDTVKDTENGVEDKEGAFNYMGRAYTLTDNDTAVRDDDNTLVFRRDEEGGWFYDENNDGKRDANEEDMTGDFIVEANRARSVEDKDSAEDLEEKISTLTNGRGNTAFVTDVLMGDGFGYAGIGISRNLSEKLAIAGTVIAGFAKDKTLDATTTEPTPMGMYAEMATEQVDLTKLGASLELMVNFDKGWNMSFGGGILSNRWDEETLAEHFQINSNGDITERNKIPSSETGSNITGFIRGGIGKEFGDSGFAIRGIVDYNLVDKTLAGGVGFSYRPQAKKTEAK